MNSLVGEALGEPSGVLTTVDVMILLFIVLISCANTKMPH